MTDEQRKELGKTFEDLIDISNKLEQEVKEFRSLIVERANKIAIMLIEDEKNEQ